MQKFLLIGYLGKDPEMKYTPGGTAITTFSVASTERWKNGGGELQEHTEWFAVKTFGRRAEVVGEHLHKGSPYTWRVGSVRSLGTINKRVPSTTGDLVYVDRIEFLDSRGSGNGYPDPVSEETTVTDQEMPF